jgi:hypothetical protein
MAFQEHGGAGASRQLAGLEGIDELEFFHGEFAKHMKAAQWTLAARHIPPTIQPRWFLFWADFTTYSHDGYSPMS